MGTNYYAVQKISDEVKNDICEKIKNDKYSEAESVFNDNYKKIHIGKSSYGWKFLFNYNHFNYYDLTRESIDKFLRQGNTMLFDEYGEKINIDDFWDMVDSKSNGLGNKEYYENKENLDLFISESERYINEDILGKYDIDSCEFYSDDLRFSVFDDFS